jgi:hypothetical protein
LLFGGKDGLSAFENINLNQKPLCQLDDARRFFILQQSTKQEIALLIVKAGSARKT